MNEYTIEHFRVGMRIELMSDTDEWMSGDRFGNVATIGRKYVHVKMDRSGKTRKLHPRDIGQIIEP